MFDTMPTEKNIIAKLKNKAFAAKVGVTSLAATSTAAFPAFAAEGDVSG